MTIQKNGQLSSDANHASITDGCGKAVDQAEAQVCPPPGGPPRAAKVFVAAVKLSSHTKDLCRNLEGYAERYAELLSLIENSAVGVLQKKYPREYNSFRGAKGRSKPRHTPFDARLRDFRDWLVHVGVHPDPTSPRGFWSADCIDREKGYQTKNIRWASREIQNKNRRVSRWICLKGRSPMTVKTFAKMLNQEYSTIYRALKGGPQRRRYTPQELMSRYGRAIGVSSWQLPSLDFEHEYRSDHLKGRSTSRITWYMQKIADAIWWLEEHGVGPDSAEEVETLKLKLVEIDIKRAELQLVDDLRKEAEVNKMLRLLKE